MHACRSTLEDPTRFESQLETRELNGRELARRLGAIPGLHPQLRPDSCTRHAYHLFLFRLDAERFGAPRESVLAALKAEGVPVSRGYGLPLYRQPLFANKAFGPYLSAVAERLDYRGVQCPNCEKVCDEQGAWLEQNLLLGTPADIDDIVHAFEKIHSHRAALSTWNQRPDESRNLPGRHHARAGR